MLTILKCLQMLYSTLQSAKTLWWPGLPRPRWGAYIPLLVGTGLAASCQESHLGVSAFSASNSRYPLFVPHTFQFLPAPIRFQARRLSVERNSYGNVAGWLAGWVSVTAGIVSKPLNLSENFFDHVKAPSLQFSETPAPIQNSKGNPFSGCVKYTGVGKLAIFVRFSTYIAVYLGNGARQADGYHRTLIGNHGCRIGWYNFR